MASSEGSRALLEGSRAMLVCSRTTVVGSPVGWHTGRIGETFEKRQRTSGYTHRMRGAQGDALGATGNAPGIRSEDAWDSQNMLGEPSRSVQRFANDPHIVSMSSRAWENMCD